MGGKRPPIIAAIIALCACLLGVPAASAQDWQADAQCFAAAPIDADVDALAERDSAWACDGSRPDVTQGQTFVRWDLGQGAEPNFMITRLGGFERLTLTVIDADGAWTSRSYAKGDTRATSAGPLFLAELPQTTGRPVRVIAGFTELNHRATAAKARLVAADPSHSPSRHAELLLIAALCGMMIMPLAFNVVLSRVLRDHFVIWHTVMVGGFAALVALRSGLINVFLPLAPDVWQFAMTAILGIALAAAGMFTRSFIEPEHLDPFSRRWLGPMALWIMAASLVHAANFPLLRPLGGDFHSLALLPAMALFIHALARALASGSRAAKFQAIGWTPLVLAFAIQAATQLVPSLTHDDALMLFYSGILFEAVVTALGVADRFMAIKQQRDMALADAASLGYLADRDPLTGLMNRRAVEPRFTDLREQGFDTVALLDLDRFKEINDRFGHQCGDTVLVACAAALSEATGRNSIAIRMGGEEFMVLLRGGQTFHRVEALRQRIPQVVADRVEGLDRLVTASMGVIEIPSKGMPGMTFAELYERADTLLYEAKSAGRNRVVHEKLVAFGPPRGRKRARGPDGLAPAAA